MDWVIDILILITLGAFLLAGFRKGFVDCLIGLIFLVAGLFAALAFYPNAAYALMFLIKLPYNLANFFGFFLVVGFVHFILTLILKKLRKRVREFVRSSAVGRTDRFLGTIPNLIIGIVVISFGLALLVAFPLSNLVKEGIVQSRLGSVLAGRAQSELRPPTH